MAFNSTHLILLFLVFLVFATLTKADCSTCNTTGGVCTKGGLCMCNLWYYGDNCSTVIPPNQRKSLVSTGISGGDLAGIVIAWMFGLPALFFLGFGLIWKFTSD